MRPFNIQPLLFLLPVKWRSASENAERLSKTKCVRLVLPCRRIIQETSGDSTFPFCSVDEVIFQPFWPFEANLLLEEKDIP